MEAQALAAPMHSTPSPDRRMHSFAPPPVFLFSPPSPPSSLSLPLHHKATQVRLTSAVTTSCIVLVACTRTRESTGFKLVLPPGGQYSWTETMRRLSNGHSPKRDYHKKNTLERAKDYAQLQCVYSGCECVRHDARTKETPKKRLKNVGTQREWQLVTREQRCASRQMAAATSRGEHPQNSAPAKGTKKKQQKKPLTKNVSSSE